MPFRRVLPAVVMAMLAVAAPAPSRAQSAAALPSPSEFLGIPVGADRTLADWEQIVRYLGALAQRSPSVRLDTLGPTTEGRPMIAAVISAPENMRRLDAIMAAQAQLADPRQLADDTEKRLMAEQPAVVLISCNIHSTEIASAQMAMELAHRLVTNDTLRAALRNVVVLLVPSINPDGEQMVTEWYRAQLGTRWEGGPLPWIYHPYVGHDDNRDWYMVTQQETKLVTRLLYHDWFPEVVYDVHQMGNEGARLFVPPFVDPIDPNIDALVVREIAHIGAEMALALQERGKSGVVDRTTYDLWWHGGMRSSPMRHNMVGILTEAASARIATPITQQRDSLRGHARGLPRYERRMNFPDPWPGGTWRLRDIMDYEEIAAEALVRMLAEQREEYVRNFVTLARRQIALGDSAWPRAYVIPARQRDPGAVAELSRALRAGGVEIDRLTAQAELDGHRYDAGSLVIPLAQPYRAHVKDLFERQEFPVIEKWPGGPPEAPYDVAGWTLPVQMGVDVVPVGSVPPRAAMRPAERTACTVSGERAGGLVRLDAHDTRSYRVVARALERHARVQVQPGADVFVVSARDVDRTARGQAADALCARAMGSATGATTQTLSRLPRIALYKPWTGNIDEGWTRWLLDQFGIPYVTVTDSAVRAGLRDHFDVLLVPSMSLREMRDGMSERAVPPRYAGGLGASGLSAIEQFVRSGGRLVLLDQASQLAATLHLPVELIPASRSADADSGVTPLYAPGSVLRVLVDGGSVVNFGMPDTAAVYFTNSMTFGVTDSARAQVLARYPDRASDILVSGYLQGGDRIAGRAAAVQLSLDRGQVILFGFRPQYRGQSWGTFRMLFNALLFGALGVGS